MDSSTLQEAEEKVHDMTRRLEGKGKKTIQYALPGRIYMGKTEDDAKKRVEKLVGELIRTERSGMQLLSIPFTLARLFENGPHLVC